MGFRAGDHHGCGELADGSQPESHVFKGFDIDSSQAEHENRPKLRVSVHAQYDFFTLGSHFFDKDSHYFCIRFFGEDVLDDLMVTFPHLGLILQIQLDSSKIEFMKDIL